MRRPTVSVIIPHYNDKEKLGLCLSALENQTYPDVSLEIVVADNGLSDCIGEIESIVAGRARLISVAERGAGPARNGAAALAQGEIFAFTDADCCPRPNWIEEGVAALSLFDIVGGLVIVGVQDETKVTGVEAFERVFGFRNDVYISRKGFTVTANLFCRRAVFELIGPFKNGVPEDMEWCHRAIAKGMRIGYCERAEVVHPARRDWSELCKKWQRLDREAKLYCSQTQLERMRWTIKMIILVPLSAVAHTPKVFLSDNLKSSRERLTALFVLYRLRFWRMRRAVKLISKGLYGTRHGT